MTGPQASLFDEPGFEATAAATREAIQRVEEHADPEWREVALRAVHWCAATYPEFTADQVWQRLALVHPEVTTHEPAALGPVFIRAAKRGWIENTGRTSERSMYARRHRRLTIWASREVEP